MITFFWILFTFLFVCRGISITQILSLNKNNPYKRPWLWTILPLATLETVFEILLFFTGHFWLMLLPWAVQAYVGGSIIKKRGERLKKGAQSWQTQLAEQNKVEKIVHAHAHRRANAELDEFLGNNIGDVKPALKSRQKKYKYQSFDEMRANRDTQKVKR